MSESDGGVGAPLRGRRDAVPAGGYRPLIGAHRATGAGHPQRGYLLTVALLAGTASMPILAAISAGSATVGSTALPDNSTPFIPTPSVGPVVVPLPSATQPAVAGAGTPPTSAPPLLPAAPLRTAGRAPDWVDRPYPPRARQDRAGSTPATRPADATVPAPAPGRTSPAPATSGPTPTGPEPTPVTPSRTPGPRPSPTPLPYPSTSDPRPSRPWPPPPAEAGRPPTAAPSALRPDPSPRPPAPPSSDGDAATVLPAPVVAIGPYDQTYVLRAPWAPAEDGDLSSTTDDHPGGSPAVEP